MLSKRNKIIIFLLFLIFIITLDYIWLMQNSVPLMWDSALHFSNIMKFREFFLNYKFNIEKFLKISNFYPPLFYILENIIFILIPISIKTAKLLNIIFVILIFYFTFLLSREILGDEKKAILAAFLTALSPHIQWTSRDVMLEPGTIFFMVLTLYFLLKSRYFEEKKYSIISGISLGLSLIFKWTEFFILFFPICYYTYKSLKNRQNIKKRLDNFLNFTISSLLIFSPWYSANFKYLMNNFLFLSQKLGNIEGDPAKFTLYYFTYYIRTLLSHHLFIFLFILFICGLIKWTFDKNRYKFFLLWMIFGPYVILTSFQNKAYRHIIYIIPPIMILISHLLFEIKDRYLRRSLIFITITTSLFQSILISFNIFPQIPEKCIILKNKNCSFKERILTKKGDKYITSFREYHDDLCCYVRDEFGIWGPPRRENWKIRNAMEFLRNIENNSFSLGLVFDHRYLNVWSFTDYKMIENINCKIWRISILDDLKKFKYILIKDGNQGPFWDTKYNARIMTHIENSGKFKFLKKWKLPDGSYMKLFLNLNSFYGKI